MFHGPSKATTAVFSDYKIFGGRLVPLKMSFRTGEHTQTITYTTLTYEPLADFSFRLAARGEGAPQVKGEVEFRGPHTVIWIDAM